MTPLFGSAVPAATLTAAAAAPALAPKGADDAPEDVKDRPADQCNQRCIEQKQKHGACLLSKDQRADLID